MPDALPLAKLAPERNSLRLATAAAVPATAAAAQPTSTAKGQKRKREDAAAVITKGDPSLAGTKAGVDDLRLPTPQYNTGIVRDMSMKGHQQVLQSAFEAVPRLREAVVLLKVTLYASSYVLHTYIPPRILLRTARTWLGMLQMYRSMWVRPWLGCIVECLLVISYAAQKAEPTLCHR